METSPRMAAAALAVGAAAAGVVCYLSLASMRKRMRADTGSKTGIKYIFCINTGRSGSEYLQKVFSVVPGVVSKHEAFPILCGEVMHQFNEGNDEPMREGLKQKLGVIKKARGNKVYVETSHMFGKGFGYLLPEFINQEEVGVVILTRDEEATSMSLLRNSDVPGINRLARAFYLRPGQARNLSQPPTGASNLQLCRWYVDELMKLRAPDFEKRFPRMTYFHADLADLNSVSFVQRMLAAFGLEATEEELSKVVGIKANTRIGVPHLPAEVLNAAPRYRVADSLPEEELKPIMIGMAADVGERHAKTRSKWRRLPGSMMYFPGSLFALSMSHVMQMKEELEDKYQVSLQHTDTLRDVSTIYLAWWTPDDFFVLLINPIMRKGRCKTLEEVAERIYKEGHAPPEESTDIGLVCPGASEMLQVFMAMGPVGMIRFAWLITTSKKSAFGGV